MDWTNYLLFFLLALLFLVGSIGLFLDLRVRLRGKPATASLIRLQKNPKNTSLFFTYRANGQPVEALYPFPFKKPPYAVGDTVPILYLPNHPESFRFAGDKKPALRFFLLLFLSALFFFLVLWLL